MANYIQAYEQKFVTIKPTYTNIVLDTTYLSDKNDRLLVIRSTNLKRNIYWRFVEKESFEAYQSGLNTIINQGWIILAATCDLKRGIKRAIESFDIPVQFCHFHQQKTIRNYLTSRPKSLGKKELYELSKGVKEFTPQSFKQALNDWKMNWKEELILPKVKSAFRSLNHNLPYLFTYQQYPELNIDHTTNSLEGFFSHLKTNLRIHRGIKADFRNRIIQELM